MTESATVLAGVESHIGTITLNRPERRNALSPEMLLTMHATLRDWAGTDEVRCVVVTGGKGKVFSSGYDVASIPTEMTPELSELMRTSNPLELALSSVANYPYPVIAMINGYAYGAGLNLAMCCDIRVAADDIKVGMPPARLGLVYHPDGLRQFIDVVGMARAREIFFTGRTYQGRDVLDMGLVNRLVHRDELEASTYAMASEIAENAPLSLKGMKEIMSMFSAHTWLTKEQMKHAQDLIGEAFNSDDLKEGQAAFFEKRKPRFTGK